MADPVAEDIFSSLPATTSPAAEMAVVAPTPWQRGTTMDLCLFVAKYAGPHARSAENKLCIVIVCRARSVTPSWSTTWARCWDALAPLLAPVLRVTRNSVPFVLSSSRYTTPPLPLLG